jgi:DNA-binding transcriptional MerR regulator
VSGGLRTIKAAQRLGFTLAEIEELIALSEHRRGTGELRRRRRQGMLRASLTSSMSA